MDLGRPDGAIFSFVITFFVDTLVQRELRVELVGMPVDDERVRAFGVKS